MGIPGYTLIRSNRKTIALYIRNGSLEVRAPLKISKHDIDAFITSKEKWIAGKLAAAQERLEQRASFSLTYGDNILCCGEKYPITARDGNNIGFDGESFYMPPELTPKQIKNACIQIYRMLAKQGLDYKVKFFSNHMSVTPLAVKINSAKTRWGSCSGKKSLNFSWRLIMAEENVINYVVVHELAHIMEMNHSDRFWAIVGKVLPDYRARRERLKVLQKKLSAENWD